MSRYHLLIGGLTMTSSELEAFCGWLVDAGVAGEGYNPRRVVEDYLKEEKDHG